LKRLISLVTGLLMVAVSLTACAPASSIVPGSQVSVAQVGQITTLNRDVVSASQNKIASDLGVLTLQNFYEVDEDGTLVANKNFGTIKVSKDDKFTLTYTMDKGAKWSDGSSVDATDLALAVIAAKTANFNSLRFGTSISAAEIVGLPKAGTNTLSIRFPKAIADWKTALNVSVAAHVVGKAAGITGNVATVRAEVINGLTGKSPELLKKLADAYSKALEPSADISHFLSNGAYSIAAVTAEDIELRAVRDYQGFQSGVAEKIYFKFYADNASALKAVSIEKADLYVPLVTLNEPQSDLVTQSQTLDAEKFKVLAPTSSMSQQFVLNLSQGAFADATYKDPATAKILRQAFMHIVPKTRAYDFASMTQVITKSDSFVYSSTSKNYLAVAGSNGSANFLLQDAEKAGELIKTAKLNYKPRVRVLFDTDNPAAVAEWTLLSDHASEAGFRLTNVSSADPSARYKSNLYEVYLGAQPLIGVGVGSVQQLLSGPIKMPEAQFEELTKGVTSATAKTIDAELQTLDQKLFELGIGLPMYEMPTLLIYNQRIKGLVADPHATNSTWGYWTWQVSADK
jgi:peptide/nickel transport system substrate-binding protein